MLDTTDKKILHHLQLDALQPVSTLAKKVHTSKEKALYRVGRLEEKGIIKKYGAVVNRDFFGYNDVNILIKTKQTNAAIREQMIQHLVASPVVKWINQLLGEWSFYLTITVQHVKDLVNFVYSLEHSFSDNIGKVAVLPIYEFLDWKPLPIIEVSEEKVLKNIPVQHKKLNEEELAMLRIYTENARTTNVAIAQQLGISQKTVIAYKKNLHKIGAIVGYFCRIDRQALGLEDFKVFMRFNSIAPEAIAMVREVIHQQKEITYADIILGEWQCRMDILVESSQQLKECLLRLEEKIGHFIVSYIVMETLDELKRTSFPEVMWR